MNRNRRGGRDRDGGRKGYGGHDGLLGEGPSGRGGGGMFDPMAMNSQMNQLMLAQQLLQKQAALSAGFGPGGDLGALAGAVNSMQLMQQQQQQLQAMTGGGGFGGGHRGPGGDQHHRKRVGVQQDRDMDSKRRRRDSFGRSGDNDRFHGREDNRGNEGRDRFRSSRWEPVDDRPRHGKKGNDDYDPAEPTEDEEGQGKDSNLYCHVCNVSVYDDASFRRHLNGTKHQARMSSVLSVHQMKSSQLQSRLKAEEHLRKIEGKAGGFDPDYFCKICNNDLTIPWDRHRFSNIHKQRQLQVKRGCGWCDVHDFNNFTEVLEHRETEQHKKNAEVYGIKRDGSQGDKKQEKPRSGSSSSNRKDKQKKKEEEEELTIPEFNPENPVGRNYIIPVTGFFCKLCHKFYNNEKSAKGAHCQSEGHYEKFKAATEEKIAAREKRKEEEAAAAAAAETEEVKEEVEDNEEANKEEGVQDESMKEVDEKKESREEDEEEDYDDDLPLEDSDDEGGLVKLIAKTGDDDQEPGESFVTATEGESLLNETSANGSFTFMTGDMAQAHLDSVLQASEPLADVTGETAIAEDSGDEDTEVEDNVDEPQPQEQDVNPVLAAHALPQMEDADLEIKGNGADDTEDINDISGEGSGLSQEDFQAVSTPVTEEPVAPAKASRGRGTARRGRGRGRAKKT